MRRFTILVCCLALVACAFVAPAAARSRQGWPGNAPYSVDTNKLDAALECLGIYGDPGSPGATVGDRIGGEGKAQPVLLVHGTGATREQNWEWNYWPALFDAGFDVCWVQLPDVALGDAQISAEYVARAIEVMARDSGEKIDVLGHSQGGLQPRWAIKWFPSGPKVDDYISLATPNHGTVVADGPTTLGCFASCWQMRTGSNFLEALNSGDETPGKISYTNVYSATDELVQPVGTQALDGASNILIQELCPGRPVDHVGIASDYVTWELVMNALISKGPADPASLSPDACTKTVLPGASFPTDTGGDRTSGEFTSEEPPLMPYAR